jgi:hypothetical protein
MPVCKQQIPPLPLPLPQCMSSTAKTSAATVVNIDLTTQPVTRLRQFGSKEIRTGKQ